MSEMTNLLRRLSGCVAARRESLKLLGFAALLNAVLFGFLLAVLTPCYETNDDLNMQMIASGFYTGQPSEYLVFTNIVIGWPVRILYGLWSRGNWYLIYLLTVHYLALTAFAFLILSRRRYWLFAVLYAGFFLMVEARILLNLQFTTTAFLAGTVGVILLVDGLQPGRPAHWPKILVGIALITLMGLIREPVAPLLALISFPFLVEGFGWKGWRRLLLAGVVCTGLFLAFQAINRWYYQRDPAWAEFYQYNRLNGRIRVTPIKTFIRQAAPTVGWSENDAWIFEHWYFSDPEVYGSASKLRVLMEKLQKLPQPHRFSGRFASIYLALPTALGLDAGHLLKLGLLSGVWCLFFAGARCGRYFATLLALYTVFVVLAILLLEMAYLPQRVAYCMPLFMVAVCLYWASGFHVIPPTSKDIQRSPGATWPTKLLCLTAKACIIVWAVLYASLLLSWARILSVTSGAAYYLKAEVDPKLFEPLRTLLPPGQKPILIPISFVAPTPLEECLFFHPFRENVPFFLVPYGWLTQSPLFRQTLDQHQLSPYSLSLVDRPDVFFSMDPGWLGPLRTFYREHYKLEVRFDLVLDTDQLPKYRDCRLRLYQAHVEPGRSQLADPIQGGGVGGGVGTTLVHKK